MTIRFEKPTKARDLSSAAKSLASFAIKATLSNPLAALDAWDTADALKSTETDSAANRAWTWAARTLVHAARDVLRQSLGWNAPAPGQGKAVAEFLTAAMQFDAHEFDHIALRTPALSPVFDPARKALPGLLLGRTDQSNFDVETLQHRFGRALTAASYRTICEDPEHFKPLEDALASAAGDVARREAYWGRHSRWISNLFTDEPVFSPGEDETIPLQALYLRLRCFWNEEIPLETEDGERPDHRDNHLRTAHIADLHDTAEAWLKLPAKDAPIRVVTGGPGSGKSSFARAFAHEVIGDGSLRVAFIRLQFMAVTGNLRADIGRYFRDVDNFKNINGNPGLPENPLDWTRDDNTPLLLIFDGLDELTTKEEEAKRHAREILFQLRQMLTQMNTDGTEVRAMVLGRNVACQDALKAASLPLPIMLNVAPIIQMTRKTCLLNAPEKDDVEDFFDTAELCDLDQRETYWRTWAKLKGEAPDDIPKAITAKGMEELNAEPLLLHLLINSDYCKNSWEDAAENPNLVYEDILKKVYERNHLKDHFKSLDLTEADFLDLMECLGLAAWRGNGRTGDSEDFARVRELHLDKERQFEKIGAVDLDSVALNIHARRGVDGEGFEFIHKRFGEFLAVRGLVAHACRIADILIERDYPKNRTAEWIELLGPCAIKRELLPFLWREAMHVGSKNIDRTIARKDALTEFYNFVLANGFPISGRAKTFREEEGTQRRAEHALLAVASGLALSIPVQDAEEDEAPQHLLNVNFEGGSKSPHVMLNRLAAGPEGTGLANLARLKLAGADLIGASLYTANLREANLGRAHLNEADLEATELRGAFMSGAFMSGANLVRADLRGANLGGAYLSGANLFGANLRGANLCGANLSGALDLSLIAVNSAKGNAETKLPDYIDRSEVTWLQDDEADD